MYTIEFPNPGFESEAFSAVCLGEKHQALNGGDVVQLVKTGTTDVITTATVLGVHSYPNTSNIPKPMLVLNHDPSCRTVQGLNNSLAENYGNKFHESSPVTVVIMKPEFSQE